MKSNSVSLHHSAPSPSPLLVWASSLMVILVACCGLITLTRVRANVARATAAKSASVFAGESCASATAITSLPFAEDSTTVGALNDVDPGLGGCATGPGPDVVYTFTPSTTGTYSVGATPGDVSFDLSIYIVTDCSNPAGTCVAGSNVRGIGRGEFFTATLNAGTTYFIVVDGATQTAQGPFHFALRAGSPLNEDCNSATTIDPSRLPFSANGTTFNAANDFSPGVPCLRSNQSATGGDVVYSFRSPDTQNYDVTVTPRGLFDASVYIVTDCGSLANCTGADVGGAGDAEVLRRNMAEGTTFFIVVDGFQGDAGDFSISVVPTIPRTPPAPTNLVAHAVSATQIDLTWQDNSSNEIGFRIERSLNAIDFVEIAQVGQDVTAFSDTGLTPNTAYFYRVFAFNGFGNSDPSNIAGDTTLPNPVPVFPVIDVSPTAISFGSVRVSQSLTEELTITNAGGSNLVISAISNPGVPFSIVDPPSLPLTIPPGENRVLAVRFAPTDVRRFVASFTISSNDPTNPTVTISLDGIGTGAPVSNLDVSVAVVDFSSGSSVITIDVRNTGDADLVIGSIQRPSAPFALTGVPSLPGTFKPGEGFTMTLSFSPSGPGVFDSRITITSNDPDSLVLVIPVKGTSTPTSEQLKLRAASLFTAGAGQSNTINVIAVNGTNTDIRLTASTVSGGTFTDRGNGRGDLVFTPAAGAANINVLFTARDGSNRSKTIQSSIRVLDAAETSQVRVSWTAPATAPNQPTSATATPTYITPLSSGAVVQTRGVVPADAAGLVGYVIYRSDTPGVAVGLANIVGVVPSTTTTFNDRLPAPPGPTVAFYVVTALYNTGTESGASNETTNGPKLVNLRFSSKSIKFDATNSNVAVGAVLVVDGTQTYQLARDGDQIVVGKNARSTPGNFKPKQLIASGSTHSVQVRNPNGAVSVPTSLSR